MAMIPPADRERVTKPLAALEDVFRPLAESLSFAEGPAVMFDAAEDAE